MIAELGHFALILAFVVAIAQSFIPMWGAHKGYAEPMRFAESAAMITFLLIGLSFASLTYAFINSDFSLKIVTSNSHSAKPFLYKIAGVWGNHEGSMLLWVLILAFYGALVAAFGQNIPPALRARTLSVQAMVSVAFLAFILFTSNPFERLESVPVDGNGLNPLLQDWALAAHPPFLYLGYVGLSMPFSFAIAALIEGRVDAAWARWVRPWTLLAWSSLTVGISLGSYWAYYELGWGGWWFWDPVENASFMPWLIAAALLHSAVVVEKRSTLKSWTILLAIFAFSFSLIGTFIVRSGLLTSVHAFASDPERGVFILGILAIATGGGLALYAWRAPQMAPEGVFAPVSRESGLILNNLLLSVSTAVVFIGTMYPLFVEAFTDEKISVGAPFFDLAFAPLMIVVLIAMPIGAALPWKRGDLGRVMGKMWIAAVAAFLIGAAVWAFRSGGSMYAPIGMALAFWAILGVIVDLAERVKFGRTSFGESARRLANLPRSAWGQAVAHIGMGVTAFGIVGITAWETEDIRVAKTGDRIPISGYEIRFDGVERKRGPNYRIDAGNFTLFKDGRELTTLVSEKRFYPVQRTQTTEAGIRASLIEDVYIVIGEQQDGGGWAVRSYVKPFANWIWIGSLIMTLGGLLSLSDRRHRVGAPNRAKGKPDANPAVPAE